MPEQRTKINGKTVIPDGTLRDGFNLHRGYWEAKDTKDDLNAEIKKKADKGYPLTNTIFEDTRQAILYQNRAVRFTADLTNAQHLCDLLNYFFTYAQPNIEGFDQAVEEFRERVPELGQALVDIVQKAHKDNKKFQATYDGFFALCKSSLNPNISQAAVDEMLVQHLLTERLIRKVFADSDFFHRNVIAVEVEKVITALTSKSFNRDEFLKALDRFYRAIEEAARGLEEFSEKQDFLNTIYERFFQGFCIKTADTHGIVYTPQAIVNFMCASVAEVLETTFGKKLGDPGVNILDPCTGTGNFIANLLHRIPRKDLARMYKEQLFANEVMLLPYYIAALNIEHAYYELSGGYEAFQGLCFVDSLDMAEERHSLFTEENTERVERQRKAEINVIIGNPPYNVGQLNENDNNKNRKYEVVEGRIRETYAKASKATLKTQLYDPYVKFFRCSTDRLGDRDGIVCFVSNNSLVDQIAFDGMRKHLMQDFTRIYHVHLEGNARQNPNLAGTTYNVFGIQVGVGITVAVRCRKHQDRQLQFIRVDKNLRREEKLVWLGKQVSTGEVAWQTLEPDARHTWLVPEHGDEFTGYLSVGGKATKAGKGLDTHAIFKQYSGGIKSNRDDVVYDFNAQALSTRMTPFIEQYNSEVDRFKRAKCPANVDEFVDYSRIKWDGTLKGHLKDLRYGEFDSARIRAALYRPFSKQYLYFDRHFLNSVYLQRYFFPIQETETENLVIGVTDAGSEKPFMVLMSQKVADLHLVGAGAAAQCFPFYVYDEDGSNRRENITDWALEQFRTHYQDQAISKWDIFYYVYGILHHPGYRTKFADNLKRELPRIPFAPDFRAFAQSGHELARLHLDYEQLEPWPLEWVENPDVPLSFRVEDKMKLSKDKKSLRVNDSLTLTGIPPEVFAYRLGNRSALDWVIDQYQVKQDDRNGIRSDPNRPDDEQYIVRLVGQVVRVSLETVRIVNGLPAAYSAYKKNDDQ